MGRGNVGWPLFLNSFPQMVSELDAGRGYVGSACVGTMFPPYLLLLHYAHCIDQMARVR